MRGGRVVACGESTRGRTAARRRTGRGRTLSGSARVFRFHDGRTLMTHTDDRIARRGFLGRLSLAAAALAAHAPRLAAAAPPRAATADEGWLRALTAKHRTVFDVMSHNNGR